jgi:hypothetical protein
VGGGGGVVLAAPAPPREPVGATRRDRRRAGHQPQARATGDQGARQAEPDGAGAVDHHLHVGCLVSLTHHAGAV